VFVFLHHPRWLARYGDDWERVHRLLAEAGNVTAVFAGHIHRIRYDGMRDGIEYITLATTGGVLEADVPGAGFLHHFDVVTVRADSISIAAVPVGAVLDPREITGEVSEQVSALNAALRLEQRAELQFDQSFAVDQEIEVAVRNPCLRPIELTVTPWSRDPRWQFEPDHRHPRLEPHGEQVLRFRAVLDADAVDSLAALPSWQLGCDYLGEGLRITLPERSVPMAVAPPALAVDAAADEVVLELGGSGCLSLADRRFELHDGPFTLEGWLCARELAGRRAFATKTEDSEFGLFVDDGRPSFAVHLAGRYAGARAPAPMLELGRWHHLAGVFDGEELRLYVDGQLVAASPGHGRRTRNARPLYIGADPDEAGRPTSFFTGEIDEVRLSACAVYQGERFTPQRALDARADTLLLLSMARRGPWFVDRSSHGHHAEMTGSVIQRAAKAALGSGSGAPGGR
jgi:hypothetical protein